MPTINNIYSFLCEIAPPELAGSWDNVGHLIGRSESPVNKLLVALDITTDVVAEAKELGVQLILSHHPIIFHDKLASVTDSTTQGQMIVSLIESGIAAICMHTNLDMAPGGVDEMFAAALGLTDTVPMNNEGAGRVGVLEREMVLPEFLQFVKGSLGANGLRYVEGSGKVKRVATGCGSCGEYLMDAVRAGCDTFVTSDIKYDVFLTAKSAGINLIDAGHFPTENVIVPVLVEKLRTRFPGITVYHSQALVQPEKFYI